MNHYRHWSTWKNATIGGAHIISMETSVQQQQVRASANGGKNIRLGWFATMAKYTEEVLLAALLACGPHVPSRIGDIGNEFSGSISHAEYIMRLLEWFKDYSGSESGAKWGEFIGQYILFIKREIGEW